MSVKERWYGTNTLKISTQEAIESILSIVKTDFRICFVYIFGSRTTGNSSQESDIDIAFYTYNGYTWDDYYLFYGKITKIISSDRLDLIWLNHLEPVLTFEIITRGKVVYCADKDILDTFDRRARGLFYDYAIYLQRRSRLGYRKESQMKRLMALRSYQQDLEEIGDISFESYIKDKKTKYAVERLLFLMCESILDFLDHLLSSRFNTVSNSYEDIIENALKNRVIDNSVYSRLSGLGGFRNILAHEYLGISDNEVFKNLQKMKGMISIIFERFEDTI